MWTRGEERGLGEEKDEDEDDDEDEGSTMALPGRVLLLQDQWLTISSCTVSIKDQCDAPTLGALWISTLPKTKKVTASMSLRMA